MIELILLPTALAALVYSAWRLWSRGNGEEVPVPPTPELAPNPVRRLLLQLNLELDPPVFVGGLALLGIGGLAMLIELVGMSPQLAMLVAAGFLVLFVMLLHDLAGRRSRRFESQLLDALELMSAALQGGLPPRQSLRAAAQGAQGAVRAELEEIVKRLDLGLTVEQALRRMGTRYENEGVRLFSQALIAKWHSGGDFAALLKAVNELIRDRIKLRTQIEGQLSGARYAAIFSGALPYILIPLFLWRQPGWFESLFAHPRGATLLVGAGLLQLIGFLWLRRVLRVRL